MNMDPDDKIFDMVKSKGFTEDNLLVVSYLEFQSVKG